MPVMDYSKLSSPQLMTIHFHLEGLRRTYQQAGFTGIANIYRADEEAAAEEINLRRLAQDDQPTEPVPAAKGEIA